MLKARRGEGQNQERAGKAKEGETDSPIKVQYVHWPSKCWRSEYISNDKFILNFSFQREYQTT